jgi:signal transduction histidine kinase
VIILTIRKRLVLTVALISLIIVLTSILISSLFIDNYFKEYILDQYKSNLDNILNAAGDAMIEGDGAMSPVDFAPYIRDPITGVRIYDAEKHLIMNMESNESFGHGMMMNRFNTVEEPYELSSNGIVYGYVLVETKELLTDVAAITLFKSALFRGGLASALIVLVISLLLIAKFSKNISRDLVETAGFAKDIGENQGQLKTLSKISEIKTLQTVLIDLAAKTKLESKKRSEKIDKIRHETKTPLTVLKSNLEGAVDGIIDMDRDTLGLCIGHIDRLNKTLENIGEIVDYGRDEIAVNIEAFDMAEEVKNIVKIMKPQFNEKNIQLVYEGPEKLQVENDKNLLLQSMYNLIINSYKFSDSGTVKIRLEKSDHISLSVSDEGTGIDKKYRDKIFEAYYRAPGSLETPGEGLGLYIVMSNTKAMGGKILVDDNAGKGTVFTIKLPAG